MPARLAYDVKPVDMSGFCCFSFYLKQKNGNDDVIKKFFNDAGFPAPNSNIPKKDILEIKGKSASLADFSDKVIDELKNTAFIDGHGFRNNVNELDMGLISRNNGLMYHEDFEDISDNARVASFSKGGANESVYIDLVRRYAISSEDKPVGNSYGYNDTLEIHGYLKEENLPQLYDFVRYSNTLKDFELVPRKDVKLAKHSHEAFEEYTKKANEFDKSFAGIRENGVKVHLAVLLDEVHFDSSVRVDIPSDLQQKLDVAEHKFCSSIYTQEEAQKELVSIAPELNKIKNGLVLDEVSANKFTRYNLDYDKESGCTFEAFVSSVYNIPGLFRIKEGVDGEYSTSFVLVDGKKFNEKYGKGMEKIGKDNHDIKCGLSIDIEKYPNYETDLPYDHRIDKLFDDVVDKNNLTLWMEVDKREQGLEISFDDAHGVGTLVFSFDGTIKDFGRILNGLGDGYKEMIEEYKGNPKLQEDIDYFNEAYGSVMKLREDCLSIAKDEVKDIEIDKIKLIFNNDEMTIGTECTVGKKNGEEIKFESYVFSIDDNKNEFRAMIGLPTIDEIVPQGSMSSERYFEEFLGGKAKLSKDCKLEVGMRDNDYSNSVVIPLKDLSKKEISNDLLQKEYSNVFYDKKDSVVIEYIRDESANYLKLLVDKYNIDNSQSLAVDKEQNAFSKLTGKQKSLVIAIQKWAKENDIRNDKGYLLSFNSSTKNPQAAFNALLKQAKEKGFVMRQNNDKER